MLNDHPIRGVILDIIRARMDSHPRGLQKAIGPSEIGHPCDRWVAYKLNETPTAGRFQDRWRPTVGTFVHSGLAEYFTEFDQMMFELIDKNVVSAMNRWFVENRVSVGTVYTGDGYDIYGGCDLYSLLFGMVIDWKIVGVTTLKGVKRKGVPDPVYRVQAHAYGRGWKRAGYDVRDVGIFYLPSSGTLEESVLWHEPFDETIAAAAVERIDRIQSIVDLAGDTAPGQMEPTGHYCETRCPWYRPKSTDLTIGCPGVDIKPPSSSAHDLLG